MFETVPDEDEDDDEDMSNSDAEGSDLSEGNIFLWFYELEIFPDVVKKLLNPFDTNQEGKSKSTTSNNLES